MPDPRPPGPGLRAYLSATRALTPLLPTHLKRRLARGKELPGRWREKLGEAGLPRPEGRLVWLHAVGLGEVLALRGLIARLHTKAPDLSFLVTSGTRASAEVLARNLPPRTVHRFLPLDAPAYGARFLDHWRPDLAIWAEQEIWPGLVWQADRRDIPLALINARIGERAFRARRRARGLYADILGRFALVAAQDRGSADHLKDLGAQAPQVTGSLKPLAPPLSCDATALAGLTDRIGPRPVWLVASSHAEDEAVALAAQAAIRTTRPNALLILAPRYPERGTEIAERAAAAGLSCAQRSKGALPHPDTAVYLADTFGELGLWYRLCPVALIGGSFGPVEGHNPWEAAHLDCAILHGPRTANFASDYAALGEAEAARPVETADALAGEVKASDLPTLATNARSLLAAGQDRLDTLCDELLALMEAA